MRHMRHVRDLAVGGMGRVEIVVANEGSFARAYARKRLLPKLAADGEAAFMFLEEGRIAGLVRHANVVPVIDVGEDEEGPYLLMELVHGVPLSEVIRRSGVGLPVQITLEIARQIAEGLHAAHELIAPGGAKLELVHRDLSPSNVLVGFDGVVRVTDFGVARAAGRVAMRPGHVVGKASYMAPEQHRGDALDRRADLFALGILVAEMLRGSPILRDALESPPDPGDERDDLPPALVALCFELTAGAASDRPETARAVAVRLAAMHAALRAEEDPVDLGELVRTTFAAEQRRDEREMAQMLEDHAATRVDITLPPREPATGARPAPPDAPLSAPSPRRSPVSVGLALVTLLAFALGGWMLARSEQGDAPRAAVPVAAPRAAAAADPTAAIEAPGAAELPEVELAAPRTDEATSRRRRRRDREDVVTDPAPESERGAIRTWSWE